MTNQELNTHAIKVIGHRNPDTDSICAAIAYSRLKNKLDPENPCKPCRAGLLNRETEFVLDYFQVPAPELYTDVSPQLRDVDIRPVPGVDGEMTVRRAWANMRDQEIDTLCVVDEGRNLKGLITVKDIATANMEVPDISILAESRTSYQNVVDTLDGTVLVVKPGATKRTELVDACDQLKKADANILGICATFCEGTWSSWATAATASWPPLRWTRAASWCARAARCPR